MALPRESGEADETGPLFGDTDADGKVSQVPSVMGHIAGAWTPDLEVSPSEVSEVGSGRRAQLALAHRMLVFAPSR